MAGKTLLLYTFRRYSRPGVLFRGLLYFQVYVGPGVLDEGKAAIQGFVNHSQLFAWYRWSGDSQVQPRVCPVGIVLLSLRRSAWRLS